MIVTSIVLAVLAQAAPVAPEKAVLTGVVVDRRGDPVAGAVVFQPGDGPERTRATADDQGRFRLVGVEDRPAFLFARKSGFRFHGQVVGEGAGAIAMTMTRTDERTEAMRTRPSPLEHRKEIALARRAIVAHADKVLEEGDLKEKAWTLEALARVDPDRVLAVVAKGKILDPFYNDVARMRVVEAIAHDDPDAAAEVAESIRVTMARAQADIAVSRRARPVAREPWRGGWRCSTGPSCTRGPRRKSTGE